MLARFSAVIDAEDHRPPAADLPPLVAAFRRIGDALGVHVLAPAWEPASGRSVAAVAAAMLLVLLVGLILAGRGQ